MTIQRTQKKKKRCGATTQSKRDTFKAEHTDCQRGRRMDIFLNMYIVHIYLYMKANVFRILNTFTKCKCVSLCEKINK